jgi:hypothetical protein
MNILLWYLPFTMFFGACDLVLSESETQMDSTRSAAEEATVAGSRTRTLATCTTRHRSSPLGALLR